MANLKTAKDCPRKAFLSEVSGGLKKTQQLRSVLKYVLMNTLPQTPPAIVDGMVTKAFTDKVTTMFPFEADSERKRMSFLINRYHDWEKKVNCKILLQDESADVMFCGQKHSVTIGRLILRDSGVIEAIRYSYKAPDLSYTGKKNRADKSPDLLLLQLAGEALAAKHKISFSKCFGGIYYMKSGLDKATALAPSFDSKYGSNVINHHFVPGEIAMMEKEYSSIVASSSVGSCDPNQCRYCQHNDLCNIEFKKRKLVEIEKKEETVIDGVRLTPAQYDLVTFDFGICRVNAVAGSGKTTVVTLRTLRLVEEGCDPSKILMITFTDKARGEMRDRLTAYAKGNTLKGSKLDIDKIQVETFNSWGQKILDVHYGKLGFSQKPELIDDVTKKDIILSLLDKYRNFPLDYRNPFLATISAQGCVVAMVHIIDSLKAAHVGTPQEAVDLVGSRFAATASDLYTLYCEYNQELIRRNLIDYEDQLRLILQLEQYGVFCDADYEHLVVDEFQDSNPNQIELIARIKACDKKIKSLVVVGDDMQAIYGFRNATPENLIGFGKMFPGVIDINLEDNFRSQNPIVSLANGILDRESKIKKVIIAHRKENGICPVVRLVENQDKEMDLFVKQTKKLITNGESPASIAILCRTKGELIKMQEALIAENVPTMLRVPEIMGEAPYVKAVIALASFFKDNSDLLDLSLFAKSLGQDPYDQDAIKKSADALIAGMASKTDECEKIQYFFDLCADAKEDYVAADFLTELQDKSFKTFDRLISYCVKYKKYDTKEPHPTKMEDADAVTLITVHSSKGLEWKTVLLSLKKFRCDEEERRLLYVAVTRAKEQLLITHTCKQNLLVDLLS